MKVIKNISKCGLREFSYEWCMKTVLIWKLYLECRGLLRLPVSMKNICLTFNLDSDSMVNVPRLQFFNHENLSRCSSKKRKRNFSCQETFASDRNNSDDVNCTQVTKPRLQNHDFNFLRRLQMDQSKSQAAFVGSSPKTRKVNARRLIHHRSSSLQTFIRIFAFRLM